MQEHEKSIILLCTTDIEHQIQPLISKLYAPRDCNGVSLSRQILTFDADSIREGLSYLLQYATSKTQAGYIELAHPLGIQFATYLRRHARGAPIYGLYENRLHSSLQKACEELTIIPRKLPYSLETAIEDIKNIGTVSGFYPILKENKAN